MAIRVSIAIAVGVSIVTVVGWWWLSRTQESEDVLDAELRELRAAGVPVDVAGIAREENTAMTQMLAVAARELSSLPDAAYAYVLPEDPLEWSADTWDAVDAWLSERTAALEPLMEAASTGATFSFPVDWDEPFEANWSYPEWLTQQLEVWRVLRLRALASAHESDDRALEHCLTAALALVRGPRFRSMMEALHNQSVVADIVRTFIRCAELNGGASVAAVGETLRASLGEWDAASVWRDALYAYRVSVFDRVRSVPGAAREALGWKGEGQRRADELVKFSQFVDAAIRSLDAARVEMAVLEQRVARAEDGGVLRIHGAVVLELCRARIALRAQIGVLLAGCDIVRVRAAGGSARAVARQDVRVVSTPEKGVVVGSTIDGVLGWRIK